MLFELSSIFHSTWLAPLLEMLDHKLDCVFGYLRKSMISLHVQTEINWSADIAVVFHNLQSVYGTLPDAEYTATLACCFALFNAFHFLTMLDTQQQFADVFLQEAQEAAWEQLARSVDAQHGAFSQLVEERRAETQQKPPQQEAARSFMLPLFARYSQMLSIDEAVDAHIITWVDALLFSLFGRIESLPSTESVELPIRALVFTLAHLLTVTRNLTSFFDLGQCVKVGVIGVCDG